MTTRVAFRGTKGSVGRSSPLKQSWNVLEFTYATQSASRERGSSKGTRKWRILVEEESTNEHVVERRKRRCWTREKRRFGRGTQTTGCAYNTNRPILDWRSAV
jgi:hypothetical protein